jgi:hypothetical protein
LAQTAAAPSAKSAPVAKTASQDREMLKLSQQGYQAMRDVRIARIAIFNGDPKAAADMLGKAAKSLAAARTEAPVFVVDVKTGVQGKIVEDTTSIDRLDAIPIDGRIVLSDDYIDTPAKKAHIDKVNEHFAKGRGKEASDELRLAEVDASFSRVLMPLDATTRHVAEATRLMGEHKYYEANLALKAAVDGLRVDSVVPSEAPTTTLAAQAGKQAAPRRQPRSSTTPAHSARPTT